MGSTRTPPGARPPLSLLPGDCSGARPEWSDVPSAVRQHELSPVFVPEPPPGWSLSRQRCGGACFFRHFRAFVGACRESRIQHKRLFVSGITGRCRSSSGLVRSFHAARWRELVSCVCSEAACEPARNTERLFPGVFRSSFGLFGIAGAVWSLGFLGVFRSSVRDCRSSHAARWRTFDSSAFPVAPRFS